MAWVKNLEQLWGALQSRFAILFTIGAALSFANLLSSIQFIIDAWRFIEAHLEDIPVVDQIAHLIGAVVSAILSWWRAQLHALLGWFGIGVPDWAVDVGSVISFVVGRAAFRYRALKRPAEDLVGKIQQLSDAAKSLGVTDRMNRETDFEEQLKRNLQIANHRLRLVPRDVTLTVLGLLTFFVAIHTIDRWYQAEVASRARSSHDSTQSVAAPDAFP